MLWPHGLRQDSQGSRHAGCQAKTVVDDFNVTWVTGNPDGVFDRKIIGINGKWPLPVIEVDKGDQLVANVHNGLGDRSTSIHFHGMFQNGTNEIDGPSMNGTYWYHCHTDYCYLDGYRQALIVHDPNAYFADQYDEEYSLTMSDWYHDMVDNLASSFMSLYNPTGAEPIRNAFLVNDTLNSSISVEPNKTYLLRLINIGAFVGQYFYIEEHSFQIVEIDGVYTEPTEASMNYISVAQRYSILVKTKNDTDRNYAIVIVADSKLLDNTSSTLQLNNINWLEYNKNAPHLPGVVNVSDSSQLDPIDEMNLNLDTGASYAFLNNISYTKPKVPTLYTVLSSGNESSNAAIYGEFTHSMGLRHNDVVQIVLNNGDTFSHTFHLHGHNFQVIDRQPGYGSSFYEYRNGTPVAYDSSNHSTFPSYTMRRNTAVIPPRGYFVMRFVADNPSVWFFHCHIDWHLSSGLGMLLIEAPTQMQERMTIPQNHLDACKAAAISTIGNAAGRSVDAILDLSGEPQQPGFLPTGFTSRGIIAMAFTCASALLGIGFLIFYGLSDLHQHPGHKQAEGALNRQPDTPVVAVSSDTGGDS